MIWLILYFVIAFAIFMILLCLCCIEYKKIDNPYHSFESWMRIHENWDIIPFSIFWIICLSVLIILSIVFIPINLLLKHFDIEPIRLCS